jgi:GH15 family glucan-1,4-alpha-glucosidase
MLQVDEVGAVLWALGKWLPTQKKRKLSPAYVEMTRRAADYLISRQTERGVHANAFDTWETFIGSFTYSNASIYAALRTAARVLKDEKYDEAAQRMKDGVLQHFVRGEEYPYLVRGSDSHGHDDVTVDSASLGAIEPFELLDLNDSRDLKSPRARCAPSPNASMWSGWADAPSAASRAMLTSAAFRRV